jgi:hypothetical protein
MSLRKSPTLTPALLAANRRNAQKSTGPRMAGGKARSRLNSLRKGTRSPLYRDLMEAMFYAPPGRVAQTARLFLSPEATSHPMIARTVELFVQAEVEVVRTSERIGEIMATHKKIDEKTTRGAGRLLKTKQGQPEKTLLPEMLLKTIRLC